jgi:mannose-1-phosphate guanylyltransferase
MKNQCKKLLIKQRMALVTFGSAYKPETGYGYIERDGDNVLSFRENQIKFQREI